jgi:hypothetical protein
MRQEVGVPEGTLMKIAVVEGGSLVIPKMTINRDIINSSSKNRKTVFRELAQVVTEFRQEAKEKGIDKMSKAEIDAAVAAARRDLKKVTKRPVK